jgi:hypothetical protein
LEKFGESAQEFGDNLEIWRAFPNFSLDFQRKIWSSRRVSRCESPSNAASAVFEARRA